MHHELEVKKNKDIIARMNSKDKLLGGVPLHFAAVDSCQERTIEAAWIEDAVKAGVAVDVKNAVIHGALTLKYVSLDQELRLSACEIQDRADFSYAVFKRLADFSSSTFRAAPDFQNATFA